MMTTREEDPRVCAQCKYFHPFPAYVHSEEGFCDNRQAFMHMEERFFVRDSQEVACRYRVPIERPGND